MLAEKWIMGICATLLLFVLGGGYQYAGSVKAEMSAETKAVEGRVNANRSADNLLLDRRLQSVELAQQRQAELDAKRYDKLDEKLDRLLEMESGRDDWYKRTKRKGGR